MIRTGIYFVFISMPIRKRKSSQKYIIDYKNNPRHVIIGHSAHQSDSACVLRLVLLHSRNTLKKRIRSDVPNEHRTEAKRYPELAHSIHFGGGSRKSYLLLAAEVIMADNNKKICKQLVKKTM